MKIIYKCWYFIVDWKKDNTLSDSRIYQYLQLKCVGESMCERNKENVCSPARVSIYVWNFLFK